jgi:hypothetical protein
VRGVQSGRHGPWLHSESRRDRLVIEVGVVAKEENQALPLGQCGHESFERPAVPVAVRRRACEVWRGRRRPPLRRLPSAGLVDDDPEQPAFAGTMPTEAAAVAQRPHERVVDGFLAEPLVAQDRDGDPEKGAVPLAVDALDLVLLGYLDLLSLNDPSRLSFL